jgi:hypothetical protein
MQLSGVQRISSEGVVLLRGCSIFQKSLVHWLHTQGGRLLLELIISFAHL